jgi:hypothetical protein
MARGNWNPNVIQAKPRCRLCAKVVRNADFVRLDGVYPAHRGCATAKKRAFTEGTEIHGSAAEAVPSVVLRISPTIAGEYMSRCPDHIPDQACTAGRKAFTLDQARAIVEDAEHNSDPRAVDVGEYGTPLPIFNAYRALARQGRAAIEQATKGGA